MVEQVRQLTFNLPVRKTFTREDFFVAPCNEQAVAWIDMYPNWPAQALMLMGPKGCGKTHLGHVFSEVVIQACDVTAGFMLEAPKIVLENVDEEVDEEALFHFFNYTKQKGIGVVMTARRMPKFHLADLASRMALVPKIPIQAPDDDLMYAVLARGFEERGIKVEPAVLEYIVKRVERSFPAVQGLIEAADELSLAYGRAITIPMIRPLFEAKKDCILPANIL